MSSQTTSSAVVPSVLADDGSSGGNDAPLNRSDPDRWYFPKEKLESTPSRRQGIDPDKELTYRQQSANFIQDIGQRLQVNQLCINTAIVYMHRFYMFHSFTHFHRNAISAASIFLAAKVEEQPRKLEHVIKVAHYCLHRDHQPAIDAKSEQYLEQSAELVMNENILLQTLGFDVAIDHPHTHVVKCCQLVRASKDLAQTSYFMATNSLHLTTMCLQYKPTVVACVCIHLACKWSSWEIPRSKEGKDWFWYVDDTVTSELLEKLTTDFLQIFNKSPSRLKKKIISLNNAASTSSLSLTGMGYHGFDSSPGQHQGRSRSPSPKRPQASLKSNSQQPIVPGKPKPHGMPMPHHSGMKMPYPPGAPGSSANKHSSSHLSSHPPHGKPPHPGMPPGSIKDPHHPHHPPPHGKAPYPPHGHGQYPHGSRPGMQSSAGSSSQPHHGHGVHSKPPVPGSSSSHPYSSSSSSSSMKNMQTHPSKPPHNMPPGASKMPPNQVPGAVKNPSQPMFHSSQSHMKKPYEARPEFGLSKREGSSSGNVHHSQNHARTHDKLLDGRHHSSASGMQPPHGSSSQSSSNDSREAPHHNMPYLGQDMERSSSGSSSSSSNQKMPYMDSMGRHRMPPSSNDPSKRGLLSSSHGSSAAATNGNNNDGMSSLSSAGGSGSGAGDSHVPSKNAYRANQPPPNSSSTFGQNSQMEIGANKYGHADGFGGEFGSVYGGGGSSSGVMSIEDRRKRRMAEGMSTGGMNSSKRARSDAYMPSVPISSNSLFSPEELAEASLNNSSSSSSKRLPPPTSQFSPSALDATSQPAYGSSKAPERSQLGMGNATSEGIVFGSSADVKPDIRNSRINPQLAPSFEAPSLLHPINDLKGESLLSGGNNPPPRVASLFSPEFMPSDVKISPPAIPTTLTSNTIDIHSKRDLLFSNLKQEVGGEALSQNQHISNSYSESSGNSQSGLTGRLSSSPTKREDGEDSHSKKSKKNKKEKHKHKHKDEKKHKKDKHKDKEKEKDKEKKDKHRSKDKHSSSSSSSAPLPPPVEVTNDVMSSHKIKIKLPRGGDESSKSAAASASSSSSSSSTRHSSSNKLSNSSSSASANAGNNPSLPGLKVKISNKGRVSSVDDDGKYGGGGSPGDHDTPCCPGFGPCLTCNRDSSQDHQPDQYRFFSSAPVTGGSLTMKFAKSKESSKSSSSTKDSSSSKDSKKSKEKTSKSSSSSNSSGYSNSMPIVMSSGGRLPSLSSSHHLHKNGMEKSSKKKDKSAV